MPIYYIPLLVIFFLVSGCSQKVDGSYKLPLVYRLDIQQGNVIDQEMIDKLKPGMEKEKVKFIMGTPLVRDPFHNNRWDYIYSMEPGGGERKQRRVTLYFRGDRLAYIDGDISVNENLQPREIVNERERSVSVPLEESEEGFFDRMFSKEEDQAPEQVTPEGEPAEITQAEEAGTPEGEPGEITQAEEVGKSGETSESAESLVTRKKDESSEEESKTVSANTQDPERNTNLIKRFWDRMTSGADDSTIAEGEESERDRRDAEMLEQAGEGL